MATVTKTWTFDSDNEGLADAGMRSQITFAWYASDGSPSSGCMRVTTTSFFGGAESARKASTADTWETWGVPAGATVTHVHLAGKFKSNSNDSMYATANIIASNGALIASGAGITYLAAGWTEIVFVGTTAVSPGYQSATTSVRLNLNATANEPAGTEVIVLDSIVATMTYTEGGGGGGGAQIPAAISSEVKARGHANLRR